MIGVDIKPDEEVGAAGRRPETQGKTVLYSVNENPPWFLSILLGLQNFLTAESSLFALPILLSQPFCMDQDLEGLVDLIGTMIFVSGISTFLQTTFGVRLGILQGGTAALIVPTLAIMSQPKWECPYTKARAQYYCGGHYIQHLGSEDGVSVNFTSLEIPEVGSEGHKELWQLRVREIQGAILVASLVQVVLGFSGAIGFILRFVGPLAITPTITLIGLSLFPLTQRYAAEHWWIALLTIALIAICSQYLKNVNIPCCACTSDGETNIRIPFFSLFPVLLGVLLAWGVCGILTATDVFPNDPTKWGYLTRTDIKINILKKSKWFRFPYPGQWGLPTVTVASTFGIMAGIVSSMIESVGDYYACAKLSGAPPPPSHAVNRGIGMEGLCSILAGAWGTGNGTTSYSQNVGSIGLTKVGSRLVFQISGVMMICIGCLGKFSAIFVMIPGAIIGGMFMVSFGMVVAIGLSNLQYVNLNSGRNVFILGVSILFGLTLPTWLAQNNQAIDTGSDIADQILHVLLSTSMFVGGLIGFVLDNTMPGSDEDRGIRKWRQLSDDQAESSSIHVYDMPFGQTFIDGIPFFRYVPFCPSFTSRSPIKTGHVISDGNKEMPNGHPGEDAAVEIGHENTSYEPDHDTNNTKF